VSFDASRRLIVQHKFLLGDHRVPAFCALSRLQLHEILLGAAERAGVQVVLGVTISEIQEEKERVDVEFSNGRRDSFDLLAGFDGIRSTTRLHVVGTSFAPRHSGYGAWRVQGASAGVRAGDGVFAGDWEQDRGDATRR
jgi:2-polyprenyl-6-methoxyphenol hydroxylase-like FAD-dependent oxidoreductase